MDRTANRYIPQARGYIFEIILYFIEMGKTFSIVTCALLGCALFRIFNLHNPLFILPLSVLPIGLFFAIFIGYMLITSYNDPLTLDTKLPRDMSWLKDSKTIGIDFAKTQKGVLLAKQFNNKKIPIETFIEAYMAKEIDIIDNKTLEIFFNRYDLFTFVITLNHIKWFFGTFLGQLLGHSIKADHREVGDVYNRGNDFYNWFLGESMVYTSAIFHKSKYHAETLEEGQTNKLDTVCKTVQMKPGMEHLDIGCGWGTLVIYAAKQYGTNSTGCTLAKEQVAYAKQILDKKTEWFLDSNEKKSPDVKGKVSWVIDDYRKIPEHTNNKKFDVITCIEMAEHVGIKNFQPFLKQVQSMLKDNGLFYIQMAGVRRTWCWEDIIWIIFMGKYIFPGADASTPVNWVVHQLEKAGFEIHRLESLGCHYARTIQNWHENWTKNKKPVLKKYGEYWYRLWDVFLAWSTMIAYQGSSNVYMITCNKNSFNDGSSVHNKYNSAQEMPKLDRNKQFIGPNLISYQQ